MSIPSSESVQNFNIGAASRLSGLRVERIRAWERRHKVVAPRRGEGGHRLYSSEDIERLRLLRSLTESGYSIGAIAGWTNEQLRAEGAGTLDQGVDTPESNVVSELMAGCLEAIRALDGDRLRQKLAEAVQALGPSRAVSLLIGPLLARLGDGWRDGSLRPMHEHLATATIRSMPTLLAGNERLPEGAPKLLTATPSGQQHELGALIVSAAARWAGWRVTHLGPDVPAADLAAAIDVSGARALALSITYPFDDADLVPEIQLLRELVGEEFPVLVGGRAAAHYASQLAPDSVRLVTDLDTLQAVLDAVREGRTT